MLAAALLCGRRARWAAPVKVAGEILVAIVALEHLFFLYLEMVLWTTPRGRAIFGTTAEQAEQSAALAKNQGLYNGFLAAGLVWGLIARETAAFQFKVFFLACVLVAAVFGGATVSRRILLVQGGPAVVGLVLVLLGGH
jgi:putative membrane protein